MIRTIALKVGLASALAVLTPVPVAAQSQAAALAPLSVDAFAPPSKSPFRFPAAWAGTAILSRPSGSAQTAPRRPCRPGRRAWIGALIGAGASIPLARIAHDRWENEAANGAGAAATVIALGAGAGALVGLATCR